MKKLILYLSITMVITVTVYAQAPQAFKYQAIARDDAGNILINNPVGLKISMVEGNKDGIAKYIETQLVKSNPYGMINLVIGEGEVVKGDFADINWGEDSYFVKMEMDITGGTEYKEMGTSTIYSVPYALYAEEAGHLKQQEPTYKSSEVTVPVKSTQYSGTRETPNSKISSGGDSWLNALTGNVGIGTNNPLWNLDVRGSSTASASRISLGNSDNSINLHLYSGHETDDPRISFKGGNALRFTFYDGGLHELVRIQSDGKVGIGTTSPAGILDIAGAYHFPDTDGTSGQALQTDGSGTISWEDRGTPYTIGDFAQGGIVFWLDETGQHGLVCAKVDQDGGSEIQWYNGTNTNTEAHGDGVYAGEMNTMLIIANQGSNSNDYAAGVCANLTVTEGGKTYGDWYLPSKQELNLMYQNKDTIDDTAEANGGSAFPLDYYWSSTESNIGNAWLQDFYNGFQGDNNKNDTFRVRAVRAF